MTYIALSEIPLRALIMLKLKEKNQMPRKPKTPCRYTGCRELTEKRYCDKHYKLINKNYNRYQRNPETYKRYDKRWRKIRKEYIKSNPMCEMCERNNKYTPAQEVHHIKPLSEGGTHKFDNLMSLCKPCHSRITATEGHRWG